MEGASTILQPPGAPDPASPTQPPGAASPSSPRVQTTLRRSSSGRFNLVFKHDSVSGLVAIQAVGESDGEADGRGAMRENDKVARVNGVETVRAITEGSPSPGRLPLASHLAQPASLSLACSCHRLG